MASSINNISVQKEGWSLSPNNARQARLLGELSTRINLSGYPTNQELAGLLRLFQVIDGL